MDCRHTELRRYVTRTQNPPILIAWCRLKSKAFGDHKVQLQKDIHEQAARAGIPSYQTGMLCPFHESGACSQCGQFEEGHGEAVTIEVD